MSVWSTSTVGRNTVFGAESGGSVLRTSHLPIHAHVANAHLRNVDGHCFHKPFHDHCQITEIARVVANRIFDCVREIAWPGSVSARVERASAPRREGASPSPRLPDFPTHWFFVLRGTLGKFPPLAPTLPSFSVDYVTSGGRPAHARVPVVEEAAAEPSETQGVQQNVGLALRLRHGRHGGGAARFRHKGPQGDADRIRDMHDFTGGRAHARVNDIHVHTAEHRGHLQSAQHQPRARVTARASALVHRGRVGLLHAARAAAVPVRDRDTLLGEVLRFLQGGRLVGLRRADTRADNLHRVRDTLLPQLGHAQVRGDGVRYTGARVAQGTDRVHGRRG